MNEKDIIQDLGRQDSPTVLHDEESYIITLASRHHGWRSMPQSHPELNTSQHDSTGRSQIKFGMTKGNGMTEASERMTKETAGTAVEITAPLPGIIIGLPVQVGDKVSVGQEVAVLEAMKMENSIEATAEGVITAINVKVGDSVLEGTIIININ